MEITKPAITPTHVRSLAVCEPMPRTRAIVGMKRGKASTRVAPWAANSSLVTNCMKPSGWSDDGYGKWRLYYIVNAIHVTELYT